MAEAEHPADEHIKALESAVRYMKIMKAISPPGYDETNQARQAKEISDAVPRGTPPIGASGLGK